MSDQLPDDALSPGDQFSAFGEPIRRCWQLGFHDGVKDLRDDMRPGALRGFADSARAAAREALSNRLGDLTARLAAAGERLAQHVALGEAARDLLLPWMGLHPVALSMWLTSAGYLLLSVAAVLAEMPLASLTVGEAFGNLSQEQMQLVRQYATWALVVMLCVMGFGLKPLLDVLEHRSRRWWEVVLAAVAVALCGVSVYGVAELRSALEALTLVSGEAAGADASVEAEAADLVTWWAAFTFKWMTLALPLLASVCVAIALHQIRSYRQHNRALRTFVAEQAARLANAEDSAKLTQLIADATQELEALRGGHERDESFEQTAGAAYAHGRATGRAARIAKLCDGDGGIYDEIAATVYGSLGTAGGVQ